jgi:hypothetical protein
MLELFAPFIAARLGIAGRGTAGSGGFGCPCDWTLDEEFFRRREPGRDDVALSANEVVMLVLARRPARADADLEGPVPVVFADRIEPASESPKLMRFTDLPSVDHFDSTTLPTLLGRPASDRVTE